MAGLTGQGVNDKTGFRKFPKTIPSLNLSVSKTPRSEGINVSYSEAIDDSAKRRIKETLETNVALQRRGSSPVVCWTNPLESSANPVIISTHPVTPRGDDYVTRSLDDSQERNNLSSIQVKTEHPLVSQDVSNLTRQTEETDSSVTQNDVVLEEVIATLTSVTPYSSRAPVADDTFELDNWESELAGEDKEHADPVVIILLNVLQQLEQERCAEQEKLRREKQNYRDTLQRQRKPRARQRKMPKVRSYLFRYHRGSTQFKVRKLIKFQLKYFLNIQQFQPIYP